MSTPRPDYIDLRSKSQASVSRPLRSPRLHVAGEAPPELSPLDAFALQSRLLAKQLEESARQGRRMSRLPPLTDESPLIVQGRSDYFRSLSQDSASEDGDVGARHNIGLGLKTQVEDDIENRPRSMHPRLSNVPPTTDESVPVPAMPNMDSFKGRQRSDAGDAELFFGVGARREQSPSPLDPNAPCEKQAEGGVGTQDSLSQQSPVPNSFMTGSPERIAKNSFDATTLVPPRPIFTKRSSSLMSSPLESTDEEATSALSASFYSQTSRKFSSSSGVLSPSYAPYQRSPSVASDASGLPRPQFNFSRPLSRAGTPSFDSPARQTSSDSHGSFTLAEDSACTPISTASEVFQEPAVDDGMSPAPSYIYSKFSLPRGKALQRSSVILFTDKPAPRSSLDENPLSPTATNQTYPMVGQSPPSPPTRSSSAAGSRSFGDSITRSSQERSKLGTEVFRPAQQPSPDPSRPSTDDARTSDEVQRGRSLVSPLHDAAAGKSTASASTSDSASTIKAGLPAMSDLSAEEHVSKAIALHESGSLQESAWHLRHAAKKGHPTGMLLYALACRHGWGMRPNPREGVEWLRKAAESASLEMADEEDQAREGKRVDVAERKTRKAQFALSIYELGVSHMNGWGIEQDKTLALRCFEIAASWGDVDALAEAGFCYAQGIGCKKNLKKSAKFYREAEAKGMSMVGNSWIHKAKYDDDPKESEKQSRSKSRSRKSIFSRKTHQ
ncbi:Protein DSF2 [Madurella mycetomatis]|uniref:Protein DSF2 n=1 Tax=Madurella mycetomatis TaxID=100816 RepID=A0A175WAF3_9PEZI|nr:Protein DSF2 [Madurella mycetomatis]